MTVSLKLDTWDDWFHADSPLSSDLLFSYDFFVILYTMVITLLSRFLVSTMYSLIVIVRHVRSTFSSGRPSYIVV